ncbi:MAG TPA: M28 family peptidase [Burkholderiales bacterium]|nr:M28 family peptidase [Burkholderiales bacterium]
MKLPRRGGRIVLTFALIFLTALAVVAGFAAWLVAGMPGASHRGPLPPLDAATAQLADRLEAHVLAVASEEHNVVRPEALERSARYIEASLSALGYAVRRQEFETGGVNVRNLEAAISGDAAGPAAVVVVGAHYDSRAGAVGANDNGSGVAALLELARMLKDFRPANGVELRLVFYVNEEEPYARTEHMGSLVHADALASAGRQVLAMISLETIGYYSDEPGSQRYPAPLSLLYPRTGDFIGFVGNLRSRRLVRRAVGSFRAHAAFPAEGGALPDFIPDAGRSDHWAYWRHGWLALMVTDTAPFRYPHYHTPRDTPDKLDYERLARVVNGLEGMLRDLTASR